MTKVSNDNFYGIRACVSSVAGGFWHLQFFLDLTAWHPMNPLGFLQIS